MYPRIPFFAPFSFSPLYTCLQLHQLSSYNFLNLPIVSELEFVVAGALHKRTKKQVTKGRKAVGTLEGEREFPAQPQNMRSTSPRDIVRILSACFPLVSLISGKERKREGGKRTPLWRPLRSGECYTSTKT